MKPLNNYISESIYGNLGIGIDVIGQDFMHDYNNLIHKTNPTTGIEYIKNGIIDCGRFIHINEDTEVLLNNGHLPSFDFRFENPDQQNYITIDSDKFTSCENLPKAKYVDFDIKNSAKNIDFSELSDCNMTLRLTGSSLKDLSSLKKCKIYNLHIVDCPYCEDILRNTKCLTIASNGALVKIISDKISSDDISMFFKRNDISGNTYGIQLEIGPDIDSYDFMDDIHCLINGIWIGNVKDFGPKYDGLFRNAHKILDRIRVIDNKRFCDEANARSKQLFKSTKTKLYFHNVNK